MASNVPLILDERVRDLIPQSKVFVVGAGGIGCEILKNLALSGFNDIEVIDLDTIDVSNLNRQFLFRKEHVGKPKSVVARESILNYKPDIKIKAYHDSITKQEYGVNFFKRFKVVLNALDNRAARNHVNRMCLAADVPLIESGTAGYTGQVELVKKGVTYCYECFPKPTQKTFPGCTIRNTPSEPVHCIVWAKHLFNQLFGEDDPDQDVSPDTADPEAAGSAGDNALNNDTTEDGNIKRKSTRQWAEENSYEPSKLFNKFFQDDINYLLSMKNLWKTRKPPKPLSWQESASHEGDINVQDDQVKVNEMQVWSLGKCAAVFAKSIAILKEELKNKTFLMWDKDDKPALDFVTACANIRAHIFSIPQKSRFDVKSIAGNIIPAIATTNAMIAGLVVMYAFRVLAEDYERCFPIYVRAKSSHSKNIIMAEKQKVPPNPKCYVCSPKPCVTILVDIESTSVKTFEMDVLKGALNMIAPDVYIERDNTVVISSEEGETEINNDKTLNQIGIHDGTILKADDFLQNYELTVIINNYVAQKVDDPSFKVVADPSELKPKEENGTDNGEASKSQNNADGDDDEVVETVVNDLGEGSSSSKRRKIQREDEDDCVMVDDPCD